MLTNDIVKSRSDTLRSVYHNIYQMIGPIPDKIEEDKLRKLLRVNQKYNREEKLKNRNEINPNKKEMACADMNSNSKNLNKLIIQSEENSLYHTDDINYVKEGIIYKSSESIIKKDNCKFLSKNSAFNKIINTNSNYAVNAIQYLYSKYNLADEYSLTHDDSLNCSLNLQNGLLMTNCREGCSIKNQMNFNSESFSGNVNVKNLKFSFQPTSNMNTSNKPPVFTSTKNSIKDTKPNHLNFHIIKADHPTFNINNNFASNLKNMSTSIFDQKNINRDKLQSNNYLSNDNFKTYAANIKEQNSKKDMKVNTLSKANHNLNLKDEKNTSFENNSTTFTIKEDNLDLLLTAAENLIERNLHCLNDPDPNSKSQINISKIESRKIERILKKNLIEENTEYVIKCSNKVCLVTGKKKSNLWRQIKTSKINQTWLCLACYKAWKKNQYCYYCDVIYRDNSNSTNYYDSNSWIQCDYCEMWQHISCEESDGYYHDISKMASDKFFKYMCPICRNKNDVLTNNTSNLSIVSNSQSRTFTEPIMKTKTRLNEKNGNKAIHGNLFGTNFLSHKLRRENLESSSSNKFVTKKNRVDIVSTSNTTHTFSNFSILNSYDTRDIYHDFYKITNIKQQNIEEKRMNMKE